MFPQLTTNCRNRFSFRLGAPSYVHPADILPNVEALVSSVDEIELILFESSRPENLPSISVVNQLAQIGQQQNLGYIVHLPLDCPLGAADSPTRERALASLMRFVRRTMPLNCRSYVIHLDHEPAVHDDVWHSLLKTGLRELLEDCRLDPRTFAVEMLDYPLSEVKGVIEDLDLSVCFEVGHLLEQGRDLKKSFEEFKERITTIHLHAEIGGQSHQSLSELTDGQREKLRPLLLDFTGSVVAEVFSYDKLDSSLKVLEELLNA